FPKPNMDFSPVGTSTLFMCRFAGTSKSAYSDKVKSDLEVPAKRHMKSVEVPTGEKSMFGLGKEIMKTEKKPTKNVVISERDYKNLVTAARDNDRLKQHVRNLMS